MMAKVGGTLLTLAIIGVVWPTVVAVPFGIVAGWIGVALLARAARLRSKHRAEAAYREKKPLPEPVDQTASGNKASRR
jgi:hypothetical protein